MVEKHPVAGSLYLDIILGYSYEFVKPRNDLIVKIF
jgi:hypothetical protein